MVEFGTLFITRIVQTGLGLSVALGVYYLSVKLGLSPDWAVYVAAVAGGLTLGRVMRTAR